MSLILEKVSFTYPGGEKPTLDDLNLRMDDGEFVGVMGRTGCGKTTLLQLVAGLLAPDRGRVLLDGQDVNARGYDRSALRRAVGVVFQYPEYQLFESSVEKDVAFGLKHAGLSRAETLARVRWALTVMGFSFEAVRALSPLSLSGGEKRRVAIAGVLAAKPRLILFDEPVAGLDPLGRADFLALARRLNREGATILMVSHNADALAECAHRLLVLDAGKIACDGTPAEVFGDADAMRKMRLGVSAPAELARMLQARGVRLPTGIVRYEQLIRALTERAEGGVRA